MEVTAEGLARLFEVMTPLLDERQRRVMLGATAEILGRGGQARVTEASGASRSTVIAGMKEVKSGAAPSGRVRAAGAGPKLAIKPSPQLPTASWSRSSAALASTVRICSSRVRMRRSLAIHC